ncbi:TetR family transcriptional regulator [Parafrankia colletiae]|uniref:TetR family transcriptional regulator n=1 Tax=Parafrankia colletiae TaxID=573497 RepID=A0A1S1R694_9ACTN|nr:TetR/AcrR family transcriptional regulator [Parafrankia colletiae]MCK9905118.1 TetR/AcrR family transcriptional regulator [Frankia sp. Cpl3]OHV40812.1 TetR family transcriptional regulator [Parafrankia colletiae]
MSEATTTRVRSAALHNRERILTVALEELSRSADVPLSAIAKKAGVGQGTFYRHFPNREALVLEVYRHEMQQAADAAPDLLQALPPDQALRTWMDRLAQYAIAKAGLADAIRQATSAPTCPGATGCAPVFAAAELLLRANQEAGTIRAGVTSDDLFLAVAGLWQIDADSDWKPRLTRLLDLVMNGLRAGAPATQQSGLPS